MTEDQPPQEQSADRRGADRQISVLINAGIEHKGDDALCRIRNLSSGGIMLECGLPLEVDDVVSLQLRSGHHVGGIVRWVRDGKAGIAFREPGSAALISGGQSQEAPGMRSPIGHPLFRREAWVRLAAGHRRGRARVVMISPTGILVETAQDWGTEDLFTVSLDGLGEHIARREEKNPFDDDEPLALIFVQPLLFRAFNDWLAAMPREGSIMAHIATEGESTAWA